MLEVDVVIIGAGPVGIFGAFQAGMLKMTSCIIDALDVPGGQCSALYPEKPIFDIPSQPKILAQDLIDNLVAQASPFEPIYLLSRQVDSLTVAENKFILGTSKGDSIVAKAIFIAAGAGSFGPNRPPLDNIEEYEGKSIFYHVSKKDQFKGKNILIAGGGDSAVDWAISLSEIANVSIVHRRAKFRAAPSSIATLNMLAAQGKIKIITDFQLSALKGKDGVLEEVELVDLDGNKQSIVADIMLPFFGLAQNLGPLLEFGLAIKNHHIEVSLPYFETNIPGIYAVGDVATYEGKLKLILTGFAEVASSFHHAYPRVFDGKSLHFEYSTTKGVK